MSFTEILKVIPTISDGDAKKLEDELNKRFNKVGKKFGGSLLGVLGGVAGVGLAAAGILSKVLSPLEDLQKSVDKSLQRADDLSTNATQFGTSSGNLARLHAFGQATGLDAQGVDLLIGKFQQAVANQTADPTQQTAVANFVGRQDTAEAFFEFLQSRQKLNDIQKNLVDQEVFGGKQILKASEFLNGGSLGFEKLNKLIGGPSSGDLTQSIERTGALNDTRDILRARNELNDIIKKDKLIGPKTITSLNANEEQKTAAENKQLSQIDNLIKIQGSIDKLTNLLQDQFTKLAPALGIVIPGMIGGLTEGVKGISSTRGARGIGPAGPRAKKPWED